MTEQAKLDIGRHAGNHDLSLEDYWNTLLSELDTREFVPDSYIVFDIETTGVDRANDHILQIGWLICVDGEIIDNDKSYISVPEHVLTAYDNGPYVTKKKEEKNEGYVKSADVRAYGKPAKEVLSALRSAFDCFLDSIPEAKILGHNISDFDVPFLERISAQNDTPIVFDRDRLLDTGGLIKASKLRILPWEDGSLYEFFHKAKNTMARGVFWNLATVSQEYDLINKYGVDITKAHDAATDCLIVHYLWQEIKKQCKDCRSKDHV